MTASKNGSVAQTRGARRLQAKLMGDENSISRSTLRHTAGSAFRVTKAEWHRSCIEVLRMLLRVHWYSTSSFAANSL